jgi:hypothetical protein
MLRGSLQSSHPANAVEERVQSVMKYAPGDRPQLLLDTEIGSETALGYELPSIWVLGSRSRLNGAFLYQKIKRYGLDPV